MLNVLGFQYFLIIKINFDNEEQFENKEFILIILLVFHLDILGKDNNDEQL